MAGGKIDILIEPDTKGFQTKLESGLNGALATAGKWGAAFGVALGAADAAKAITSVGMEFDSTMNNMAAVSQATSEQLDAVRAHARELGTDASLTATSANDAAAAMTELAKGGFSVEQSMSAAKGTLQLASAAQTDAANAATIQAQALQAFGLQAEDAARVSDILAGAANASSAEIGDVAAALQQSGTVANQFGVSIEDTSTAIAMFANAGITGSDAGTLLKTAMLALTDQGKPAQSAIEELGLTVYDAQGKFVGMSSLMGQLNEAAGRMSDEQYQAATATLFGSDAMRLAGIAAQQGSADFDKLREAVTRQGQAAEVAAAQTEGLPGVAERLQNTVEDLSLGIYDAIDEQLIGGANAAVSMLEASSPAIIGFFEGAADGAEMLKTAAAPAGEALSAALGGPTVQAAVAGTKEGLGFVKDGIAGLIPSAQNLASALAQASAALGVSAWDLFIAALNAAGVALNIIDGPLETVTGFLEEHPGLVAAALAAWTGFNTLPGIVSGITSKLTPATEAVGLFGGAVKDSWRYASQANPQMGAFGKSMLILKANGVSASGALGGLKAAGSGLLSMFGGPWGVALAAAGMAVASVVDYTNAGTKAEEAIAESAKKAAAAHETLTSAVGGTTGALSGDGLSAAIDLASAKLTEFNELGQLNSKWQAEFDLNPEAFEEDVQAFVDAGVQAGDAQLMAANQVEQGYKELQSAMEDLGMSQDDLNEAVATGGPEYDALIDKLRGAGDSGEYAADKLEGVRDEMQQAIDDAQNLSPEYLRVSDAIETLADSSSSAEDKMSALDTLMQEMGLRPKDTERAMRDAAEAIDEVSESATKLAGQYETTGQAMLDANGKLDWSNESSRALGDELDKLYESLVKVATNGGDVQGTFESMQPALDSLQQAFGLTDEQMQGVIEQMGLVPDEISTAMSLTGASEAEQEIMSVVDTLEGAPDGKKIEVTAPTAEAIEDLEAAGVSVERIPGSKNVLVSVEDITAQEALDALGIKTTSLPGGKIEVTDTTDENMKRLEALGLEVSKDKKGRVIIEDNSKITADRVRDNLDSIKDKTVTVRIQEWREYYRSGLATSTGGTAVGQHYNTGGRLPRLALGGQPEDGYRLPTSGPGTGTIDGILGIGSDGVPTAWVNRGEWVVNEASSDKYNATIAAINADNPGGILAALRSELSGLAEGGRVSAAQLLDLAHGKPVLGFQASRSLEGALYDWAGINWGDCSGAMSALARFAAGLAPFGGRFATGNEAEATAQMGFLSGLGHGARLALGWLNGGPGGGHTSGSIDDGHGHVVHVEMGGARGNGQIGGAAAGAAAAGFTNHAWIPLAENDTAGAPGTVAEGTEVASTSVSGMTLTDSRGNSKNVSWGSAQGTRDLVSALMGTTGLYDEGGWLMPGGFAYNATARPEPILSVAGESVLREQTAAMMKFSGELPEFSAALREAAAALDDAAGEMSVKERSDVEQMLSAPDSKEDMLADLSIALKTAAKEYDKDPTGYGLNIGAQILPEVFGGVADAENALQETREKGRADLEAVTTAEEELAQARKELAEAEAEGGGISKTKQRKIDDAEESLAKARESGKVDKIAAAEKKLKRAREDAADELEKTNKKNADKVKKAAETVSDAELNLADARQTASQIAGMVAGAEVTMAIEAAKAVYQAVKFVVESVEKVVDWVTDKINAVRGARADAVVQMSAVFTELASAADAASDRLSALQIQMINDRIAQEQAMWSLEQARATYQAVQLSGLVKVAQAQKAIDASELAHIRVLGTSVDDLHARLIARLDSGKLTFAEAIDDVAAAAGEKLALDADKNKALAEAMAEQAKSAQSFLEASRAAAKAALNAESSTKLLATQAERLRTMTSEYQGLSTPEAMKLEYITGLVQEAAEWDAKDKKEIKIEESRRYEAARDQALGEAKRLMGEWFGDDPAKLKQWKSEMDYVLDRSGHYGFWNSPDKAKEAIAALIKTTSFGKAQLALGQQNVENKIADYESQVAEQQKNMANAAIDAQYAPEEARLKAEQAAWENKAAYFGAQGQYYRSDSDVERNALVQAMEFNRDETKRIGDYSQTQVERLTNVADTAANIYNELQGYFKKQGTAVTDYTLPDGRVALPPSLITMADQKAVTASMDSGLLTAAQLADAARLAVAAADIPQVSTRYTTREEAEALRRARDEALRTQLEAELNKTRAQVAAAQIDNSTTASAGPSFQVVMPNTEITQTAAVSELLDEMREQGVRITKLEGNNAAKYFATRG